MIINKLIKVKRSTRNAISASLIIIVAFVMYNWFTTPHAIYLSAAKGYNSAMDDVIKYNKIIKSRVDVRKKKYQELNEKISQLQDFLFTPEQTQEFFSDLQAISEQSGCTVYSINLINDKSSISNKQSQEDSGIVIKSTVLSVMGVYKNIVKLIHRLQSRPQKVWLDGIKLRSLDYDTDRLRCDITITICEISDKDNL